MDLPIIYGDDQWMLHEEQGHARVTKTKEAFEAALFSMDEGDEFNIIEFERDVHIF